MTCRTARNDLNDAFASFGRSAGYWTPLRQAVPPAPPFSGVSCSDRRSGEVEPQVAHFGATRPYLVLAQSALMKAKMRALAALTDGVRSGAVASTDSLEAS
jgi:hypothetical protein